jgi:hypothetical protein
MSSPDTSSIAHGDDGEAFRLIIEHVKHAPVKKFIFLVVVAFVAFTLYQKNAQRQREMLIGVWSMEEDVPGVTGKLILNLKDDGKATIDISARSVEGRIASREGSGTWKSGGSHFAITFDHGDILPLLKRNGAYGGKITRLDDKSLTYSGVDGSETWTRIK